MLILVRSSSSHTWRLLLHALNLFNILNILDVVKEKEGYPVVVPATKPKSS
jgi:hypothetical protein